MTPLGLHTFHIPWEGLACAIDSPRWRTPRRRRPQGGFEAVR
jgi:hypothetical protein